MDAEGLKDLFEPFGAVAVKRLFGGHGVYAEGLCFAIEADGEVYLKCDAENEPAFVAAGSAPFVYGGGPKPMTMSYWRLVAEAYDEPDALRRWAALGLGAARRAAEAKAAKSKKAAKAKKPAAPSNRR